jgi:hypothetical protein
MASRRLRLPEYNEQIKVRRRTDPKFLAYAMWNGARGRAKRLGIEFTLSRELVERGVLSGKCEVTGLEFDHSLRNKRTGPFAPSIDRKNPKVGYTDDNCQIVCWLYNRAKGDGNHAEVMMLVEALHAK